MERYKVIVPKLNVRKAPVADFQVKNIITTVNEGLTLDLVEVIDIPNPSLGKWYTDGKGQFYSGLGLQTLEVPLNIASPKKIEFNPTIDHWWITDYGIDKIWEITRGAGVKIAIIDSGLDYNHSDIKNKKNIQYYNVITGKSNKEDCFSENYYHGTKCTGIIAAQGPNLYGVAPEADLLIIKATEKGSLNPDKMIIAIRKAIELNSDIISISYDYKIDNPQHPIYIELLEAVKEAVNKNILVIASVGNNKTTNPVTERFPASFAYSLSVGSINKEKKMSDFTINENIDLLAPGEKIMVLNINDNTLEDSGTSFSTPYVAGICALYLSKSKDKNIDYLKGSLKTDSLNKIEIRDNITKFTNINIPNLGIINPKKLFNI